jgi:hypothetical protein
VNPHRVPFAFVMLACASCALVANLGDRTLGDVDVGGAEGGTDVGGGGIDGGGGGDDGPASGDSTTGTDRNAPPETRIDPLDLGRTWTYDITAADGSASTCPPGAHSAGIVGPGATIDGGPSLRYQSLCSTFLVDAVVEGDRVTVYPIDGGGGIGSKVLILDAPVEEGHTWNSGGGQMYVWHDAGTVVVPAGTFPNCWARAYSGGQPGQIIYCRGVGLTRVDDLGYDAVLTSKNF